MIEALIRDENRLISVLTIRQGPDKDRLDVDLFIPRSGTTFSGVMPAGGEVAQQVARAIMTVYPVSALSPNEVLSPIHQKAPDSPLDGSPETLKSPVEGQPVDSSEDQTLKAIDRYSGASTEEVWDALDRKMDYLNEREKQLERDIENFRKSHPEERAGN